MTCPNCGTKCEKPDHEPWRCPDCGWYEGNEVDAAFDASMDRDEDEE